MYKELFNQMRNGLVVSCQSEEGDLFNQPDLITLFAKAAIMGGAAGIRSEGIEVTRMIVENVNVPVIGLLEPDFEGSTHPVTGKYPEVEALLGTGCHIIAIDGTFRIRDKLRGPEFIQEIKKRYNCCVMADVSTYAEGVACSDYGADCISSKLSGHTSDTSFYSKDEPDFNIIQKLIREISIPVFAEGKIKSPKFARKMIEYGAWAVIVGSAITRPRVITSWYIEEMKKALSIEDGS